MPMIRTPTDEELIASILAGYHGAVEFDYELWQSNITGDKLALLDTVDSASVNLSNDRDNTWELGVNLNATQSIDPFLDYVLLVVKIRTAIDEWYEFPRGLYRFTTPKGSDNVFYTDWDLIGESLEVLLLDNQAYNGYRITAGAGALTVARTLLTLNGIPASRINFPVVDNAITKDIVVSPQQNAEDAKYLRIINKALASGGFYALYTDSQGFFTTHELDAPKPVAVKYTANKDASESGEELICDDIQWEYSREFLNKVSVYSADGSTDSPTVWAAAELHSQSVSPPDTHTLIVVDPESAFTYEALGGRYFAAEPKSYHHIADLSTAKRLASAYLQKVASRHFQMTVPTMPDPRREPRETYRILARRSDGSLIWDMRARVTGWEMPLDLSQMTHEVGRNVEQV
jgi:hypothetical protein